MQMDQKIFTRALTTETLSCYLLLTGMADAGHSLSLDLVESLWSGDASELERALKTLDTKGIIALPEIPGTPLRLLPSEVWRD